MINVIFLKVYYLFFLLKLFFAPFSNNHILTMIYAYKKNTYIRTIRMWKIDLAIIARSNKSSIYCFNF